MKGSNFKVCHTALALVLLLGLASCGDKKNSTNSSNNSSSNSNGVNNSGNWSSTQYQDNTNYTSQQASQINSIKSSVNCQTGARLSQDVIFGVQGGAYNSSTIGGTFQAGSISGTVSMLYVGISAFNDLMFVSKVTNGNSVLGYNVRISMCPQTAGNFPFIGNERPLSGFTAPQGITLNDSTVCGVGQVTSAQNTTMVSGSITVNSYGYQTTVPAANVVTTFYAPRCNQ